MLESILFVLFLILLIAVVLSPLFYFFRKKSAPKVETEIYYSKIPWRSGIIYALLLVLLIFVIIFKPIFGVRFGTLEWFVVFSILSFLYSKTRKVKLKKSEKGFGFYLVKEIKTESNSFQPVEQVKKENNPVLSPNRITPHIYIINFWKNHKRIFAVFAILVIFVSPMFILRLLLGSNLNFLSNRAAFDKKKECQELGNYIYQDFKARYGIDNLDTPEYTYNSGLDTCLTYIQYFPQSGILREGFREVVIDSLTREELTSYYWHPIRDKEDAKRSKEAFDSAKKIYFSGDIPAVK